MGDWNTLEGVTSIPVGENENIELWSQVPGRVKARFEDWMELTARRRPFKFRDQFNGGEYREQMDSVTRCVGSGQFSWGGEAFLAALQSLPGVIKLIVLLAEHAAKMQGKPCTVDAERVAKLMQDEKTRGDLQDAVRTILEASPNFLAPPLPGEGTEP